MHEVTITDPVAYKKFTKTIEYNNIYLVPRLLSRTSSNTTLFDIYMNNDKINSKDKSGRSINGDNRIISKFLQTTSFGIQQKYNQIFLPAWYLRLLVLSQQREDW